MVRRHRGRLPRRVGGVRARSARRDKGSRFCGLTRQGTSQQPTAAEQERRSCEAGSISQPATAYPDLSLAYVQIDSPSSQYDGRQAIKPCGEYAGGESPVDLTQQAGKDALVDIAQRFGQNLARLRERGGQTQEEVAARAELHRTVISQIETGKREARTSTIVKLAGALSIDPGELFAGMRWTPSKRSPGGYEFSRQSASTVRRKGLD
jgi:DNA-binding XRE family transcriptional regulator